MSRARTEISVELLEAVRIVAEEMGLDEREVLEDAVKYYLMPRAYFARTPEPRGADIGDAIAAIAGAAGWRRKSLDDLFERIDRGQRERGVDPLSEDEAMKLADEELHAMRREREAGR